MPATSNICAAFAHTNKRFLKGARHEKTSLPACGAGAATSTLVAQKVATLLDANGYADKYEIVQCAISEAKDVCDEGADLLIATTVAPEGLTCPYVSGVPFMTGMNRVAAEKAVLDVMAQ